MCRNLPERVRHCLCLTDGENNNGTDPGEAVAEIIGQYDVTIHTVTFSPGADKAAMKAVAEAGHGRHYPPMMVPRWSRFSKK